MCSFVGKHDVINWSPYCEVIRKMTVPTSTCYKLGKTLTKICVGRTLVRSSEIKKKRLQFYYRRSVNKRTLLAPAGNSHQNFSFFVHTLIYLPDLTIGG